MNYVIASMVLGFVHIGLASGAATKVRGIAWNAGARDSKEAPLEGVAGRLERASKNFMETFPLLLAAILANLLQDNRPLPDLGLQVYFFARLLYLPLYAFGIPYVRSLVWVISVVGIIMVAAAAVSS